MKNIFKVEHYGIATSVENVISDLPYVAMIGAIIIVLSMISPINKPIIRLLDLLDDWLKPK